MNRGAKLDGLPESAVDVRVVAATKGLLQETDEQGEFRGDLYYRLDMIRMNVPPQPDRPEDALFLFGLFCKQLRGTTA